MWGYDRAEDLDFSFVPYKTQDEHFALFCLALERGFSLHTGSGGRLLPEYRLTDTGGKRYLPQVSPRGGLSFRVPDTLLKPSDLFLYYDPSSEDDIPQLAYLESHSNRFLPYSPERAEARCQASGRLVLPVVKLGSLRGLHYTKDIACLELFELDFKRLRAADAPLAEHLRETLASKLEAFVGFSQPWLNAARDEALAQAYLSGGAKAVKRLVANGDTSLATDLGDDATSSPFMGWDST